jgi:hypothetical protein
VEHLKGVSLVLYLALPANIKLSWKGLPGTNTLAYYENPQIKKSFIVQAPGAGGIKLLTDVNNFLP